MKEGIHPTLNRVVFIDTTTGRRYVSRSTMRTGETEHINGESHYVIHCSVTADSHPAYTGEQRFIDTAGRIDKFKQRYATVRRADRKTPKP